MMKKVLIALFLLAPISAHAQSSKSAIVSDINTDFADNTSNAITAAMLRGVTTDMVSSYVDFITCTSSGGMVVWDNSSPNSTPRCITPGNPGQILQYQSNAASPAAWVSPSTAGQYQSATANKFLDAAGVFAAAAVSAITDGVTTFSTDWNTGFNFSASVTRTSTLPNPTNVKVGQTGCYFFTQGASTTGVISSYGTFWKFSGGVSPALSTTINYVDALCYFAKTTSFIWATMTNNVTAAAN